MDPDVIVVGAGVAGLTAATYTARAGLDTTVVSEGEPILARNAHLENVPGFPLGVNARTFLELCREGAAESGATLVEGRVTSVARRGGESRAGHDREADAGFLVRTADAEDRTASFVVAASWPDPSYLDGIDGVGLTDRGSKTYVDVDDFGRAGPDGLYAAGRIAEKPHQTVVCAGHGAEVALALIEDSDVPYYHDWVTPEGYFTERGREIPPGCEEIDEAERRERERAANERMRAAFAEPQSDAPTMHPAVVASRDDADAER
jgi:thioredoxin reductase (NADPH)